MNNKILLGLALFFSLFILSCAVNDPSGIYAGVTPAADCPGISVVVILSPDSSYKVTYQYIDRGDGLTTFTGTYSYDKASKIVTLNGGTIPPYYKAGNKSLTQLDMEGKVIKGQFAAMYVLRKI